MLLHIHSTLNVRRWFTSYNLINCPKKEESRTMTLLHIRLFLAKRIITTETLTCKLKNMKLNYKKLHENGTVYNCYYLHYPKPAGYIIKQKLLFWAKCNALFIVDSIAKLLRTQKFQLYFSSYLHVSIYIYTSSHNATAYITI